MGPWQKTGNSNVVFPHFVCHCFGESGTPWQKWCRVSEDTAETFTVKNCARSCWMDCWSNRVQIFVGRCWSSFILSGLLETGLQICCQRPYTFHVLWILDARMQQSIILLSQGCQDGLLPDPICCCVLPAQQCWVSHSQTTAKCLLSDRMSNSEWLDTNKIKCYATKLIARIIVISFSVSPLPVYLSDPSTMFPSNFKKGHQDLWAAGN